MIIAISGKKGSGKDTVGKIMQILLNSPHLTNKGVKIFLDKGIITDNLYYPNIWQIKKFADKLKDIVCLLIGCTREQLEDEEFKSKPLGEEWIKYQYYNADQPKVEMNMTPRLMLQLLGTECGRNIIHPQIWVNSLMSEYKTHTSKDKADYMDPGIYKIPCSVYIPKDYWNKTINCEEFEWEEYPNWIITDMRFPNEQQAVDVRDGISIRVNRHRYLPGGGEIGYKDKEHESETALDDALFDYTIDNDGTIDELIDKIRLIIEKIKCKVAKDN